MNKIGRLKELIETYERFEKKMTAKGITFGETEGGGFWTPTRFDHAIPFLEYAVRNGLLIPSSRIVDAGSADARMAALFGIYGLKPIGIELDQRLIDVSHEVIDYLAERGILSQSIRIVQGDFTKDSPYSAAGIPFERVPYFYMAINSEPLKGLTHRVKNNSPKGTKVIVYGMIDEGKEPDFGLRLERRFRTSDGLADFLVYNK